MLVKAVEFGRQAIKFGDKGGRCAGWRKRAGVQARRQAPPLGKGDRLVRLAGPLPGRVVVAPPSRVGGEAQERLDAPRVQVSVAIKESVGGPVVGEASPCKDAVKRGHTGAEGVGLLRGAGTGEGASFGSGKMRIRADGNEVAPITQYGFYVKATLLMQGFANTGYGLIREMELHAEAGFHPTKIIQHCTGNNAKILGVEDKLGRVRAGWLADLIVVDGNPLEDIKVLYAGGTTGLKNGKEIRTNGSEWVIKDGIPYNGPQLLREVKAIVTEAAEFATQSPEPEPSELYTDVLADA